MSVNAIKCVVFVVVLTNLLRLSRGDVADAEVSCVFMESCILPCSFQAADGLLFHWIQVTAGNTPVHSYYRNQDQLTYQGQRFRGRTSLFKDQISRGNASLQLTRVEVQDQGRYQCYTSTIYDSRESFINLKVDAPVRKVDIQQVGNRITCSSEGIYPEPELTWSTSPPSNETFRNTTTVQKTEQQLYNISSSLILSHSLTDLDFSCNISTRRNWRRETLSKPNPPDVEEQTNAGTVVGPVVGGILAAVIVGLAAFWIYRRIKNRSTKQTSGTAASELQKLDSLTNGTENGGGRNDPEPEEETNLPTGD